MSNPDFDTLATSTLQKYMPGFEDNIFKNRPLLAWIQAKVRKSCEGGREVVKPILDGENNTVGSYKGYDTLPCTPQKGLTAAVYSWCQYQVSISLCGLEMDMNSGSSNHIDLLRMKTYQAQESLKKRLAHDLLLSDGSGNAGKDVIGLEGLIGNEWHNPVFGGIDGSKPECAYWRSYIDDNGYQEAIEQGLDPKVHAPAKPLTFGMLGEFFDCISCNDPELMPDLILMSKELYQGYRATLQPNLIQDSTDMANMGFKSLQFMDTTIMWDPDVPADRVYFLNSRFLDLVVLKNKWMKATAFQKPVNQDAICAHILNTFLLCTDKRQAFGMICNLKPAC